MELYERNLAENTIIYKLNVRHSTVLVEVDTKTKQLVSIKDYFKFMLEAEEEKAMIRPYENLYESAVAKLRKNGKMN